MEFRESLAKRMKERYETKYALAKSLGVQQSTVANWLNGESIPQLRYVGRIAEHYGCSADEILRECGREATRR